MVARSDFEQTPYIVVHKEGPYEIREYSTMTFVQTPMPLNSDDSFTRLFRYMSGYN